VQHLITKIYIRLFPVKNIKILLCYYFRTIYFQFVPYIEKRFLRRGHFLVRRDLARSKIFFFSLSNASNFDSLFSILLNHFGCLFFNFFNLLIFLFHFFMKRPNLRKNLYFFLRTTIECFFFSIYR
jgi:hypothetical protein